MENLVWKISIYKFVNCKYTGYFFGVTLSTRETWNSAKATRFTELRALVVSVSRKSSLGPDFRENTSESSNFLLGHIFSAVFEFLFGNTWSFNYFVVEHEDGQSYFSEKEPLVASKSNGAEAKSNEKTTI